MHRSPACHLPPGKGCFFFLFLLLGLPDPFAKVVVDGSGQCHSTDTVKNTLDPKWNQHYDL
uniref:C2 domain-containing protein n=1 Tax=Cyanistes caeruleus TaxID=156563 RepID=A0A8C0V7V6_CYACU